MKILFFSQVSQELYGANRSLLDILIGLKKNNHDVRVFLTSEGRFSDYLKGLEIPYYVFSYSSSTYSPRDIILFYKFISKYIYHFDVNAAAEKLGDWTPDIIYTNNTTVSAGLDLSQHLCVPHVWHVREYGWDDYSMLYVPNKKAFLKSLNKSSLVIFISYNLFEHYRGSICTETKVLINPIAEKKISLDYIAPQTKVTFSFLCPGFIHKKKGQFLALKAFRRLLGDFKNIQLIFAGNGSKFYIFCLKFYCFLFGIRNKVIFLGYVENMDKVYRNADCVLVCSDREALGRVSLEGMMYGIPVIGRNTGGTSEILGNNERGLLFNGSVYDLADKMKLLIMNPSLCKNYSVNGRNFINANFIKSKYIESLEESLLKII